MGAAGLGDDGGIGAIAALQASQRAVARAFFLDDRLEIDLALGLQPGDPQRVEGEQVRH